MPFAAPLRSRSGASTVPLTLSLTLIVLELWPSSSVTTRDIVRAIVDGASLEFA